MPSIFAAQGKHVLLVLDSLTRFAMAAREIGLAAGEPPTAKGYTPSVFNRLARLIERAGQFRRGSITAFYTVLMEGDDQQDPLVDAVRSLPRRTCAPLPCARLRGVVSAHPNSRFHQPPHALRRYARASSRPRCVRRMLAVYARSEDLVRIGAYKPGTDTDLDRALRSRQALRSYLEQDSREEVSLSSSVTRLTALAAGL